MTPKRRAAADLQDTRAFSVPARHGQALPPPGLVRPEMSPSGEPLSFLPGTALRARRTQGGRWAERGLQTSAGHDGAVLPNQCRPPWQGGKGALPDHPQRSIRQPALPLKHHRPRPLQNGLRRLPVFLLITLARRDRRATAAPRGGQPRASEPTAAGSPGASHGPCPKAKANGAPDRGKGLGRGGACPGGARSYQQPPAPWDQQARIAGPAAPAEDGRLPAHPGERGSAGEDRGRSGAPCPLRPGAGKG